LTQFRPSTIKTSDSVPELSKSGQLRPFADVARHVGLPSHCPAGAPSVLAQQRSPVRRRLGQTTGAAHESRLFGLRSAVPLPPPASRSYQARAAAPASRLLLHPTAARPPLAGARRPPSPSALAIRQGRASPLAPRLLLAGAPCPCVKVFLQFFSLFTQVISASFDFNC